MIKSIKGTKDLLPKDVLNIQDIEKHLMQFLSIHGYGEIRTPIFESTELFARSVGEHTDIVKKEMYTWVDQNGQSLTLRPEMTASVIRSYIQKQIWKSEPISKYFYIGPAFRRERPQKGRLRQFHQFGIESIGSQNPEQDAEVISMAYNIYKMFGIENLSVKINSLGSIDCRQKYSKALKESLKKFKNDFNENEIKRLENNPLRILDTKNKKIRKIIDENAPSIFNYISDKDKKHFEMIKKILIELNIPYVHDQGLVRGLDYYTKTVFEITSDTLGAQDALCGGGRYDNLIENLGGKSIPAIGFAAGMERLLIAMNLESIDNMFTDIYIVNQEAKIIPQIMNLADIIRKELGVSVYVDSLRRSMKSQLRHADKLNAKYCVIFDYEKLKTEKVYIKNMNQNEQQTVSVEKIISYFEQDS